MRSVVILLPVVQINMATSLLMQLNKNTLLPSKVIIIDDSDRGFSIIPETRYPVVYKRWNRRGYVNEIFNAGMCMHGSDEFIMLGNDDIIIHDHFLESIVRAFDDNKRFGAVCPMTAKTKEEIGYDNKPKYFLPRMREGAVFAFRTSMFNMIPPIPKELKIFFADDWWWNYVISLGYLWGRIESSRIYHYGSTSVKQRGMMQDIKGEKDIFMRLTGGRTKLSRRYRIKYMADKGWKP